MVRTDRCVAQARIDLFDLCVVFVAYLEIEGRNICGFIYNVKLDEYE